MSWPEHTVDQVSQTRNLSVTSPILYHYTLSDGHINATQLPYILSIPSKWQITTSLTRSVMRYTN